MVRRTCALWRVGSLFGVLLAAPLAQSAPKTVKLDVLMADYRFEPDRLTFQRGVRYQLHLENKGKETHEFTAPVFLATAAIENPDILDNRRSELTLEPGE